MKYTLYKQSFFKDVEYYVHPIGVNYMIVLCSKFKYKGIADKNIILNDRCTKLVGYGQDDVFLVSGGDPVRDIRKSLLIKFPELFL